MAGNLVNILVGADGSQATSAFEKVNKSVMIVSAAVAGVGLALSKIGDEFQVASRNITAGTGATGKELEALKKEFRDVAANVPQDFDTVSKAIASVKTELKLTGDDLEGTTKMFLDLSRVTGTELEPLIKSVSDSMDMFGVSADQAGSTMDAFAKASQVTGVPIAQLTARTTEFGPVLRNLGLGMNDTIALMGQFEGAGISVSRVMPGLNASMRRMAASGTEDMAEGLRVAMTAIKDTVNDTEALNLATDLFGAEGAQRMSVAIRDGTVDIDELSATLGDAKGTVDEMTESTMTSNEKLDIMKNRFKLAIEPVAGFASNFGPLLYLIPAATAAMSGLVGILKIQNLAMAGGAIKAVALAVAKGIATAATWLLVAAQAALRLVMGPIGAIIIGITLAIAAGIAIWKNWDKIVAFVTETLGNLGEWLSTKFPSAWEFITNLISTTIEVWKGIFKGFVALFKGDWDGAIEHFKGAFSAVKDFFVESFGKIWAFFDDWMTSKFGSKWETVKDIVGAVFDKVKGIVTGAFDIIKGIVKTAIETVGGILGGLFDVFKGVWDLIVGIFTGDTDAITQAFKGIVNGIIIMMNSMINLLNKILTFKMPDWAGGMEWGLNLPNIPELAEGGIVKRPTLAMIGEAGPEAVVPLKGGGGLGGGVTVNVMMPAGGTVFLDDESTAQRFGDFISDQVRQVLRTQGAL
jgi:TP901 family phage tail tape measure protein